MAREHFNRYSDREPYYGETPNRRHLQRQEYEGGYDAEDTGARDDRQWRHGPDDWNSPYASREWSSGEYRSNDMQQGRTRQGSYRDQGQGEWDSYDRGGSSRRAYRNGATNQADGATYGPSMRGYQESSGYSSYGRRGSGGMRNDAYYGDTESDNYGGGGYDAGRYGSSWQDGGAYGQQRGRQSSSRGSGYGSGYGAGYMEDSFGSLRDPQREGYQSGNGGANGSQQRDFSGRGPKGWKRSDERIQEELNEQLERHPGIDASEIEVKVSEGEVTLSGTTSDRQMKRLAEDIAESISGVHEVQNQIRVQRSSDRNGSTDKRQGTEQQSESKQGRRAGQLTS